MKTIKINIEKFLLEQQERLKTNSYDKYLEILELFTIYLNNLAIHSLDESDRLIFERNFIEGRKEFCDIFSPDILNASHFEEFMDYYMIRKVYTSNSLLKAVGVVLKKYVKWLYEHRYMSEVKFQESFEIIKDLKGDLPQSGKLSDLIYNYIDKSRCDSYTKSRGGYFSVVNIESGKLWLVDEFDGDNIGPVYVSNDISSRCKKGWVICLELGKTAKGWVMISSGNVYPQGFI